MLRTEPTVHVSDSHLFCLKCYINDPGSLEKTAKYYIMQYILIFNFYTSINMYSIGRGERCQPWDVGYLTALASSSSAD